MTQQIKTSTGDIYVSASTNGVSRISWGQPASADSQAESENAAVQQLQEYFAGSRQQFDLSYDLSSGTPFQQRVWQALLDIPYGKTMTYGELAQQLNSSPRAVGGAVGANPLPIIIPCHRVMGANGKLTGFSGGEGVSTKQQLLELEQSTLQN